MAYYVSACKDNGSETETCDDSEAQFWTLYVRDDAGLSQGIIDLAFREDAEAVMAVYVERDDLKALAEGQSKLAGRNAARAQKAEAEIARRDVAASEAVGLVEFSDYMTAEELAGMKPRRVAVKELFEGALKVGDHLYTAAPPAVLPPEKPVHTDLSRTDIMQNIAYNQALNDVKELGAQPQKPVSMPESVRINNGYYFDMDDIFVALDAANVPYEVKK